MRECEQVWLNLPEGSHIGRRMAAAWRAAFSGSGARPSREEEQLVEFWPQGQLRALRACMVRLFGEPTEDAFFIHPQIRKSNDLPANPAGITHKITIEIEDYFVPAATLDDGSNENRHRNVFVTFHHADFPYSDWNNRTAQERPWQIQCADD